MIVVLPEFEPRRRCEAIIDAATMAQAVRDTSTLREVAATSIARPVIHRVHETVARIGGDAGVVVDYWRSPPCASARAIPRTPMPSAATPTVAGSPTTRRSGRGRRSST